MSLKKISAEYVIDSLAASEEDKDKRGLKKNYDQGLINAIHSIRSWHKTTLPIASLGAMQMYISRDRGHGTETIFNFLNSLTFNHVASAIDELRGLDNQETISWLEKIDKNLQKRIIYNETQPLIICWPPLFEAGNVLDGNHRLLSLLKYKYLYPHYKITNVLLGTIPINQWIIKFAKGYARSKLPIKTKLSIAKDRLSPLIHNLKIVDIVNNV